MPTFVTPLMLGGGLLVAVPIVLHLVMREKPKHLVFPAMRFIQNRREANRKKLRLRHLLLLALRCATILLLALALARPVFQSAGFFMGKAPVSAALVFDTRPRMAYKHQNETRLQLAKQLGQQVIEQIPRDSDLVVLDAGTSRSRFDIDRGAAAQRIEQLEITYAPNDLVAMLDGALSVLRKSDKRHKEVFVFTDLAAVDWQSPALARRWKQRLNEIDDASIYVIDVGVKQPENFSLGDLQLSRDVFPENGLLTVDVDVLASGKGGSRTIQLLLTDEEGSEQKKGEETVQCGDNEAAHVTLKTVVGRPGTHHGRVRFLRADSLPADDVRNFTVRVQSPWRVLVVAGEPVQAQSGLLVDALAPPKLKQRGDVRYDLETANFDQLEEYALTNYSAIWMIDPAPLKPVVWEKLIEFVTNGGGLGIALGGRAGLVGEPFNASASMQLLPAELRRQWRADSDNELFLAPERLEHPVLQKFKRVEAAIPWDLNPVFKMWELGQLADDTEVVISYSNRRPAVVARNVGRGRVMTLTTSLAVARRSPWNTLLLKSEAAWVGYVLVNSITEYLVGSVGQRMNYEVGDMAEIRLDGRRQEYTSYLLSTPDGTRRVKTTERDHSVSITGLNKPGQYRLAAGGQQGVLYGFSVNLQAETTRVGRADIGQLNEQLGDSKLAIVDSIDQLNQSRRNVASRTRWEGFPWLILLLAIVVVGETLLSSLFYRNRTASGDNGTDDAGSGPYTRGP
ncbi:MAG: BatA domain-containing protein [Pirellulales bacterium]